MVAPKPLSRKALFAAALVEAGMTLPQFARDRGGVTDTQLRRVLMDPSNSAPLTAKIDAFIAEIRRKLEGALGDAGIKAEIYGRIKSISSIHRKIRRQKIDVEQVYDYVAFRILTDSPICSASCRASGRR